ncbi:GAF and ANTAR domain-containing protein [Streptomyces sp. LUP47B]|uniref:GAF and ANTAR domain-containing protein n=1 Tax=Streptomyces sp. LUP47B TaxID=1890286 RepID=UPI000851D52C|nr:GAF and ANTAR domain-containing protein [Streptomyces sp. LUP47B]
MNRERQLAQAFLALSDTYAAEFDPLHLFDSLVHACHDLLDIDAAVMIADARGGLRTMASTDEEAAVTELLQLQSGHGPCMDSYRIGEPVSVPDIAAEQAHWPHLVATMIEAGYGSLQAIPVRLRRRPLGVLTLLRRQLGPLAPDDVHVAQALADSAALALMHWSTEPGRADDVITRVQSAIASKATLEIAKGMIAQYADTTIAEASHLLTAYAKQRRLRLTETVQALVTRDMHPGAVVEAKR